MEVLYIPQLDGDDAGESPTAGRYRLLKRVPEEGLVALTDRAVTRIEVTAVDPLKLTVPPLVKGAVRDFFVRLVITADEIPEVTFAPPHSYQEFLITSGGANAPRVAARFAAGLRPGGYSVMLSAMKNGGGVEAVE